MTIRWITRTLGTAAYNAVPASTPAVIVDVRDLVDKPGNTAALVREKIDEAVAELKRGHQVVVCCDYGMSRSNAIAAGVLSVEQQIDLSEAIRRVVAATDEKEIKLSIIGIVREALGPQTTRGNQGNQRTVLLTGGAGFVAGHLHKALGENLRVLTPTRQQIDLLTDAVALDLYVQEHAIDTVIHLANPRVYTSNIAMGQMLTMMRNVLDVCGNNNLKLFYLSGWEVFSGYRGPELVADESLALRAMGPYGEAKLLTEVLIEQFARNCGLRHCIVRSGPVVGRGADRPKFIFNFWDAARAGRSIHTHRYINGAPALDLIAVEDLVSALKRLIESDADGIFHVSGGQTITTTEIAQMLTSLAGSTSSLGYREINGYTPIVRMDDSKLRTQFGWSPALDVRTAIRDAVLQRLDEANDVRQ